MAGGADVVIDAVLGTGAQGGLRGPAAELVAALGRSRPGSRSPLVVACDIPSGVDADTGEAHAPGAGRGHDGDLWCGQGRPAGGPGRGLRRAACRSFRSESKERCHGRPCVGLRPETFPPCCHARSGGRTSTPGGCLGWSQAPAPIPAPRCWPARAPWPPASAWCATLGRRTSPTSSGRPAPRSCAAPAPWPIHTFRPGSWAPGWMTPMSSSCSAPATPQTRACRRSPTPAHCPPCLMCWPRK